MMKSRVQGAVSSKSQSVVEVGESDENEREEGLRIPLVVEQDVQMVEGVLMKEVSLVDEEDGAHVLFDEVLDMSADREEQVAGGVDLGQTESEAEMTVEVAPPDGAVLAVDKSEVGG